MYISYYILLLKNMFNMLWNGVYFMPFIVAIDVGTENNPGWNCGGVFENKNDADQYSISLRHIGIRSEVIKGLPWTGTRSYC